MDKTQLVLRNVISFIPKKMLDVYVVGSESGDGTMTFLQTVITE